MQIYLYKVLSCDSIFEYEKPGEKVRLLNFCDLLLTVGIVVLREYDFLRESVRISYGNPGFIKGRSFPFSEI